MHYESVDVGALTSKLMERYRNDIKKRRLDLVVRAAPSLTWQADPILLEVVLGNLLSNAVAYAPVGSRLLLDYQSNTWQLHNDAPGLRDDDIAFMQRRFWRKGKDAGVHTGLGLALVCAAASAQSMHLDLTLAHGGIRAAVTTDRPASSVETSIKATADVPPPKRMAAQIWGQSPGCLAIDGIPAGQPFQSAESRSMERACFLHLQGDQAIPPSAISRTRLYEPAARPAHSPSN